MGSADKQRLRRGRPGEGLPGPLKSTMPSPIEARRAVWRLAAAGAASLLVAGAAVAATSASSIMESNGRMNERRPYDVASQESSEFEVLAGENCSERARAVAADLTGTVSPLIVSNGTALGSLTLRSRQLTFSLVSGASRITLDGDANTQVDSPIHQAIGFTYNFSPGVVLEFDIQLAGVMPDRANALRFSLPIESIDGLSEAGGCMLRLNSPVILVESTG